MNWIETGSWWLKAALLSLLTNFSLVALAQSPTELNDRKLFDNNTFILGVKGGWSHYQNACQESSVECDKSDFAWSGFIGYQFHQNWSFEASYNDFGQAIALYPENGSVKEYIGTMAGAELSLKGSYLLTEKFGWFTKVGMLGWRGENVGPYSSLTDQGLSFMVGTGIEYKITPTWAARFEYQYFDSVGNEMLGGSNIHFTSVGISYQFGQMNK